MIRKATLLNIENLILITKACTNNLIDKNIYQWNAFYPNKEAFIKDLERNELYVLEIENTIIGCITISTFMDEVYKPVSWLTKNDNNIYIHRLAIHPKHQRQGYAQKLMQFAEDSALKNNFTSIRLDTFSQNKRNLQFYKHRGYKQLEAIYFPNQSKHPFYCYELVL